MERRGLGGGRCAGPWWLVGGFGCGVNIVSRWMVCRVFGGGFGVFLVGCFLMVRVERLREGKLVAILRVACARVFRAF